MSNSDLKVISTKYRNYMSMELEELVAFRAQLAYSNGMLGKIPLVMSTIPLLFLIFGNHVTQYLPSNNSLWVWVMLISVATILWSFNYHFRKKGETQQTIYLIDTILHEKRRSD